MAFPTNSFGSYAFTRLDFDCRLSYEMEHHMPKSPWWKFWVSKKIQENKWLREKVIDEQMKVQRLEADVFTQRALVGQYANAEATRNRELSKKSIR